VEHPEAEGQQTEQTIDYRWVGQQSGKDCGVAALAVVTGHSYAQVRSFYPYVETSGISLEECAAYLRLFGYCIDSRRDASAQRRSAEPWPPAPFAPVHLCIVTIRAKTSTRHWVVMLAEGAVLDSHHPKPGQLSDYHEVHLVVGIVPDCSARASLNEADKLRELQAKRCYITRCAKKRSLYSILRGELREYQDSYLSLWQGFVKHLCRWLDIDPVRVRR
jgi:hypothetical protein